MPRGCDSQTPPFPLPPQRNQALTRRTRSRYGCREGKGYRMILASLFSAALVVAVATEPLDASGEPKLSSQQKIQETQPLIRSATDCIVHAVVSDPRFGKTASAGLGDLIVESMPSCVSPVRAMIDAYDRAFGDGSGEAFFMGPYLDVLPKAVTDGAKQAGQ